MVSALTLNFRDGENLIHRFAAKSPNHATEDGWSEKNNGGEDVA
jgi:hypothetical protein